MSKFWPPWPRKKNKIENKIEKQSVTTLPELFNKHAADTNNFVHLAVDIQKHFCDSRTKKRIATHIGQNISPQFNKLSIPTYWIYFTDPKEQNLPVKECTIGPEDARGGLYKVAAASGDKFIRKNRDSAFKGSDIHKQLQGDKKKVLLVTGFNYGFCVLDTVIDAREKGYDVVLFRDATNYDGPDHYWTKQMQKADVIFTDSETFFQELNTAKSKHSVTAPGPQ